ncbi:MAG TPA: sialidase domain-containing protein, partial [Sedimentisphaerales bacterium]|nr:sialidase domain-containing protein [Sedimentisphaerales bacterium]
HVGVCQYIHDDAKEEKLCWNPDGSKPESQIYSRVSLEKTPAKFIGFVFRSTKGGLENTLQNIDDLSGIEFLRGNYGAFDETGRLIEGDNYFVHDGFVVERDFVDLKLRIQPNEWLTASYYDGKYTVSGFDKRVRVIESYDTTRCAKLAFEVSDDLEVRVNAQYFDAKDSRKDLWQEGNVKSAKDADGKEIYIALFGNIKLADIKMFRVDVRPKKYQWVEFKNVCLKPKFKSEGNVEGVVDVEGSDSNIELTVESAPIAYWGFDGGAEDSVGGHDGVVYGATLTDGVSGQGYYFEGDGDCISIPDAEVFDFGMGDFSLSLWFKTGCPTNNFLMNFKQRDNNPHIELYVNQHFGAHLLPGFTRVEYVDAGIRDDRWHHAVVTMQNGVENGYKLYLDGINVGAGTYSGRLDNWDMITIGSSSKDSKDGFNGVIDEVAVYDEAISVEQVKELFSKFNRDGSEADRQKQRVENVDGLVGYWDFDGVAKDKVGGNDGVVNGATLAKGVKGQCYYFEGDGDCISIPDSEVFDFGADDFSISAWFKVDVMKGSFPFIFNFRQNDNNPHIEVYIGGDLGSHILPGDTRLTYKDAGLDDDRWHYVAITMQNGVEDGYKLYLDGIVVGKGSYSGNLRDWDSITIGGQMKGGRDEFAFKGFIDEAAVYKRALSAEELQRIYNDVTGESKALDWKLDAGNISKLEFRIVVEPSISSFAGLRLELDEQRRYKEDLKKNGPAAGQIIGDEYVWIEVRDGFKVGVLIEQEYEGKNYVLVCNQKNRKMVADGEWWLQRAYAGKDSMGEPVVELEFDAKGLELFYEFTSENLHHRLAVIVGDKICSVVNIQSVSRGKG